jgi:hypothetical protein
LIQEQTAPDCVKEFLTQGVQAYPDSAIHVKATGHLYNGDYKVSSGVLLVEEIAFQKPKAAAAE